MRRIEKCFSERITPLFLTMVVQSLGEGSAMPTDPYHTPIILHSSSQPQKTHKPKNPTRKVTEVPQPSDRIEHVADEAVHKELGDSLVRAATTASSLEAKQNSGNINRTQSKATPNESSSQGTSSGGGPIRTARVESSDNKESLGGDVSKQERMIDDIDADEDIIQVNVQVDAKMFDADKDLGSEEVKWVVIQEPSESTTTTTTFSSKQKPQNKGKAKMVEEPVKPKKKEQIRLDEEADLKLQAKFDEEQRLARERAHKEQEANIALIETLDDVQANIDADHQLAKRLQAKEQQELTNEEKATLVNTFEDFRTELVQGHEKGKRAREELIQKRAKKQKVEDNNETTKIKQLMKIIPDKEEVAIDAISLDVKSPKIVDWKIYKKGKKSYYHIIRADEKTQMYMFFSQILTSFNREYLEDL
nr:hypothetical protein [Tanacetum cinerariifolium]